MFVKIKQAVHVAGVDYKRGVQDIPEEKLKHPHFHKHIANGLVEEADAPLVAESPFDRSKRLQEKLFAAKPVESKAPPMPASEAPMEEAQAELSGDEDQAMSEPEVEASPSGDRKNKKKGK